MPAVARVGDYTKSADTIISGSPDVFINEGSGTSPAVTGIAAVNDIMDAAAQPGVDRVEIAAQHDDDPGSDFIYKTYRRNADKAAGLPDAEGKVADIAPPPASAGPDIPATSSDINAHTGAFPGSFLLSPNFTLAQLTTNTKISKYQLRAQVGLTEKQIVFNLRALCVNVLEPMLAKYGSSLVINSGFRHGTGSSQHYKGQAVDVSFTDTPGTEASFARAKEVQNLFNYDQYIYEQNVSIWHHLSFNAASSRRNVLTKPRGDQYLAGLLRIIA